MFNWLKDIFNEDTADTQETPPQDLEEKVVAQYSGDSQGEAFRFLIQRNLLEGEPFYGLWRAQGPLYGKYEMVGIVDPKSPGSPPIYWHKTCREIVGWLVENYTNIQLLKPASV